MPSFPILKTGAVAQYPATRSQRFHNQAVRFLDGTEQRYRDSAGPLHSWVIGLVLLDENERESLAEFFEALDGASATFSFTDPWDGQVYPNCYLETDAMDVTSSAEMRGATSLTIVETRA